MFGTQTDELSTAGAGPGSPRHAFAQEFKALGLYFAMTFGIGLALGLIRAFLLVPRFGVRAAEVLDTPWVLAVVGLAACYVVQRFALRFAPRESLSRGLAALGLLLAVQFIAVLRS